MKIKLYQPMSGTLVVEIEDETTLLSLQDLIKNPAFVEYPRPIVIEADEPPLTGLITIPSV